MRIAMTVAAAGMMLAAAAAMAQEPVSLTPLETAVACAPPPTLDGPAASVLRVIGTQDTNARNLAGQHDLIVIDGGTKAGVQLGQEFFVRRPNKLGERYGIISGTVHTAGWIRVVAVNDTTSIAAVEHMCDGMLYGDYLEKFVAPRVPAGADRTDTTGEPNFTSLARVLVGDEDRVLAGTYMFTMIDRGSAEGVAPGARVAIYRDVRIPSMPLASIAEGVVVSVGPHAALTRVTAARDAVINGDYVAFRK